MLNTQASPITSNTAKQALPWRLSPIQAIAHWPINLPLSVLHSGRHHPKWSRWTILASPQTFVSHDGKSTTLSNQHSPIKPTDNIFNLIDQLATDKDVIHLGYISYDIAHQIETLPNTATDDRHWPLLQFAYCPGYLLFDNQLNQWYACGSWADGNHPKLPLLPTQFILDQAPQHYQTQNPTSNITKAQHIENIIKCQAYIAQGDIFQANLTRRITAEFQGKSPIAQRALFTQLNQQSPAWYGAYLESPHPEENDTQYLLSTSPELFLQLKGKTIITRPIKGTLPSNKSADDLFNSIKDQAELNMIIDLMRNDLGRVSTFGSVKITQPRHIETHPTIHHGVATIESTLNPKYKLSDLIKATMPGGSITGAPKIRAMQIIDELEPTKRGPYCGSIGLISKDLTCLNIAIRTIQITQQSGQEHQTVDLNVGGGIVTDSIPENEYQETKDKAAAMLKALGL